MFTVPGLFRFGVAWCFSIAVLIPQTVVRPVEPVTATQQPPQLPAAAPAAQAATTPAAPERVSDYVLGPEDQIIVHAYQVPEIPNTPIQIGGDGYINLPLVGRIKASEMTVSALERDLS